MIYHVRNADTIIRSIAGSARFSMLDACKGLNQILYTQRAKKMLAILAWSEQFLPVCLTFGPTSGPEEFAYAADLIFARGRGGRMRLCREWEI